MHKGMTLQEMLTEVVRMNETKRDYIADTKETIRMVRMEPEDDKFKDGVALVLLSGKSDENWAQGDPIIAPAPLQRFDITENCHGQIAGRLKIPQKYYKRLLADHTDLVIHNVNTLFEREPELRMVRTIDGRARAFLSNSYRRVDNAEILEATLPMIKDEFPTTMLNCNVTEDRMNIKCLFDGPGHTVEIPSSRAKGGTEVVRAGFDMGNHETGGGSLYLRGFFYSDFCMNGCVWGGQDTVSMRQIHVGAKQGIPKDFLLSDDTRRKEDELIISASRDVLRHLASPDFTQKMGSTLRRLAEGKAAIDPHAAVERVCNDLSISETHQKSVLETFIKDQDYTQWGMVNAVTQVANDVEKYDDSTMFEEMGGKIINLPANRWNQIAQLSQAA